MASIVFGTASDFIKKLLENEFSTVKDESSFLIDKDSVFLFLNEEIKTQKNEDKIIYANQVIANFNSLLADHLNQGKVITDIISKFQSEILRWSTYWKEVAKYKLTRKYPDFDLDTENMWKFCIDFLKPASGVKYLKREYGNLFKRYKREQPLLDLKKNEILKMIKDLEVIQDKTIREKDETLSVIATTKAIDPLEQLGEAFHQNKIIKTKDQFIQTIKNGTGIIELTDQTSVEKAGILAIILLQNKIFNKKDYIVFKIKTVEYQLDQVIKAGEYELNTNKVESEPFIKTVQSIVKSSNLQPRIKEDKQTRKGLPDILTRIETAKYLNISLTTLWIWTEDKKINSIKKGSRVYYSTEEIIKFLQN